MDPILSHPIASHLISSGLKLACFKLQPEC